MIEKKYLDMLIKDFAEEAKKYEEIADQALRNHDEWKSGFYAGQAASLRHVVSYTNGYIEGILWEKKN